MATRIDCVRKMPRPTAPSRIESAAHGLVQWEPGETGADRGGEVGGGWSVGRGRTGRLDGPGETTLSDEAPQ